MVLVLYLLLAMVSGFRVALGPCHGVIPGNRVGLGNGDAPHWFRPLVGFAGNDQFLMARTSRSRRTASPIRRKRRTEPPRSGTRQRYAPLSVGTQLWSGPRSLTRSAIIAGNSASRSSALVPIPVGILIADGLRSRIVCANTGGRSIFSAGARA